MLHLCPDQSLAHDHVAVVLNAAALLRSSWIRVLLSMQHTLYVGAQLYASINTADKISFLLSMTDLEFMTPH